MFSRVPLKVRQQLLTHFLLDNLVVNSSIYHLNKTKRRKIFFYLVCLTNHVQSRNGHFSSGNLAEDKLIVL